MSSVLIVVLNLLLFFENNNAQKKSVSINCLCKGCSSKSLMANSNALRVSLNIQEALGGNFSIFGEVLNSSIAT